MVLLFLIEVSALFTFPIIIYRVIKKQTVHAGVLALFFASIGILTGLSAHRPIDSWDEVQRNRSGRLISEELEIYKSKNGSYPSKLSHLDTLKLNSTLPRTYPFHRFTYHPTNQEYDLDIPIFLDRWHWEKEKQVFMHSD